MLITTRKPSTVGEILSEEFMEPVGLTQGALAQAMGVARKHFNELCNDRRTVTAPDRAYPRPRLRQQPGVLAKRAAAHRSVGSAALAERAQADRTRPAAEKRCVTRDWPQKSLTLIEKVLVDFLYSKRVFNPAPNIMADHQLG